jgi:hypothetical protein
LSKRAPDSGPAADAWWCSLVDDPEDVIEREMVGELLKVRERLTDVRERIAEEGLMVSGSDRAAQGSPVVDPRAGPGRRSLARARVAARRARA